MLAHVIVQKFRFGMPFFRQEEQLEADGIELDRGTMARSTEDVGASLGAIVLACVYDARKHAFCLSTDAAGVAIRPEPLPDGRRQPCRKGHFFVVWPTRSMFSSSFSPSTPVLPCVRCSAGSPATSKPMPTPSTTRCSAATRSKAATRRPSKWPVGHMLADGFGKPRSPASLSDGKVSCECASSTSLIRRGANCRPRYASRIASRPRAFRQRVLRRVHAQNDLTTQARGLVSKALGYAIRQELALRRFLDDGRLRMDNNSSENALRVVATGRNRGSSSALTTARTRPPTSTP